MFLKFTLLKIQFGGKEIPSALHHAIAVTVRPVSDEMTYARSYNLAVQQLYELRCSAEGHVIVRDRSTPEPFVKIRFSSARLLSINASFWPVQWALLRPKYLRTLPQYTARTTKMMKITQ